MGPSTLQHPDVSGLSMTRPHGRVRRPAIAGRHARIETPSPPRVAKILACALTAVVPLTGGAAAATAAAASAHPAGALHGIAHISRSVNVDDHASLHMIKAYGQTLVEEGYASGTLPGRTLVHLTLGSKVTASFTIWTRSGAIKGGGGASLHSSSRYASFGGWLSVAGGGGRYARAHGKGSLYGVLDRRTHALTVKTFGTLFY
jgi:hypothetical protein